MLSFDRLMAVPPAERRAQVIPVFEGIALGKDLTLNYSAYTLHQAALGRSTVSDVAERSGAFLADDASRLITGQSRVRGFFGAIARGLADARPTRRSIDVLDIGTGSGIMAVHAALLGHETGRHITVRAFDINPRSVDGARLFAEVCGVADRVVVEQADVLGRRWQAPAAHLGIVEMMGPAGLGEPGLDVTPKLASTAHILPATMEVRAGIVYANGAIEPWKTAAMHSCRNPIERIEGRLSANPPVSGLASVGVHTDWYDDKRQPVVWGVSTDSHGLTSPVLIGACPISHRPGVVNFSYRHGVPLSHAGVQIGWRER